MATERNVVDFKIHNLTEEQFQELKAQGKIDPNAVYCTPDESLKRNQITNCITEIPQDIKLELADGALTLKAGSIVYVPNGAGVFNKRTVTTDVTTQNLSSYPNGQYLVFDNSDLAGTSLRCNLISACYSGATAPATGAVWYDTTNNKIMVASGGTWSGNRTLPLGVITISNGTISSIDQVFNGFGYIGSTIFVLPGVKGLIPNGRNEDGTLKNIVAQNTSVRTLTRSSGSAGTKTICLSSSGAPDLPGGMEYNEKENQNYNFDSRSLLGIFGSLDLDSNYKISNFNTKPAFHAVDYNDFEKTVEELNSSISAVDSSAVHKTGNETIGGVKTFTGYIKASAGVGVQINATSHSFNLRSSGATPEGCGLFVDNDAGKPAFATTDTKITIGSNAVAPHSLTPSSSDNSTRIATTAWANAKFLQSPAGMVAAFAGTSVPSGWLKCDGSAVSRTTYAKLFEAIGTRYGAGNGSTTFNLPTQSVLPLGLNADVSVLGTGKTLGFTNGTNNVGLGTYQTQTYFYDNAYNTNITNSFTGSTSRNGAFGVTTDSSKSGLKGTVNLANATGAKAIVCIKY